ncbi:sulfotransferase [bacterium]|nr:sulfotransferase [bacterium]
MKSKSLQPVIIIGMHRSGTTMITSLLEKLGLFLGKEVEINHEARFFLSLNRWLLRQSAATWDHPEGIVDLLNNAEIRTLAVNYLGAMLGKPCVINYLGWQKFIRYGGAANLDVPWGWKDPRNTYTLPVWLDLFPRAKVIHVYRNGVDVANSLQVRGVNDLRQSKERYNRKKLFYWLRPKKGGFTSSISCLDLRNGFTLWERYFRESQRHVKALGDRAIEIKYEDFLRSPGDNLVKLCGFSGLRADEQLIKTLCREVNCDRAYAFRKDKELQGFHSTVEDRLRALGY